MLYDRSNFSNLREASFGLNFKIASALFTSSPRTKSATRRIFRGDVGQLVKSWLNTWVLLLILILYGVFFNINLDFHPILSVTIKATLVGALYLGVSYFLGLSEEVNRVIDRLLKK